MTCRFQFTRLAVFSTIHPQREMTNAFPPAIASICEAWGQTPGTFEEIAIKCLMLDRHTEALILGLAEKGQRAVVVSPHDFGATGWHATAPLGRCECSGTGRPDPKRWVLVPPRKPEACTRVMLQCSWCQAQKELVKPNGSPTPRFCVGRYYMSVGSGSLESRTTDS
jgi:hypothetical protein